MLALTLWPEWAACIAVPQVGKDIENRSWPPPARAIGQRIAIHAGAYVGGRKGAPAFRDAARAVANMATDAERLVRIFVAPDGPRLRFWPAPGTAGEWPIHTRAVVATAVIGEPTRDSESPWAVPGEWHWPLVDVRTLREPVPCRGAQGLWRLPADVAVAVRRAA